MRIPLLAGALALSLASGCSSAYYATMEKFGVAKREILVDRVQKARDDQTVAKEQLQTTYEAFQALTGFQGGDLEAMYKKLNNEFEDSKKAAGKVSERIASIEDVSDAVFKEWDQELEQYTDQGLRAKAEQQKRDAEVKYGQVITSMREAEASMGPVLAAFQDRVLFLKHNLNAAAIGSLEGDALEIGSQVADLIADMEKSIAEADSFIGDLGT